MGVSGQRHAPGALPSRKDPVPILYEAGWVSGPVWTVAEKIAPHRDSLSGPYNIYRIAIPTTLSGPYLRNYRKMCLKSAELILGWLIFGSPRTILIMTILHDSECLDYVVFCIILYLVPLRHRHSPQHPILIHPQHMFLPQCERPSFAPIQNNKTRYYSGNFNPYNFG